MSDNLEKEHLDLLISASRLLNSTLDLDEVLHRLLEQATKIVGASSAHILKKEGSEWVPEISITDPEMNEQNHSHVCSQTVVKQAVKSGTTVLSLDAVRDNRFYAAPSVVVSGVRSILCTPLSWQGKARRVIYLDNRIRDGVFREKQQVLIEALAGQAAGALENAALHAEREQMYEKALAQARDELSQTQAELLNASKLAAVGELAAGIAHEVNNPLCALALNLDAVGRRVSDEKVTKRLVLMEKAVQRCRGIIERLLNFTHPSRARRGVVQLDEVVEQTLELMSYQLRDVEVETQLEPLQVEGEAANLSQVILNLLSNALHAIEGDDKPRIQVSLQAHTLEITDNGIGMTEEVKERIFEPFYTTKPVGRGTGLGLSVSFKILQQHEVEVKVRTSPGEGTTFSMTFHETP